MKRIGLWFGVIAVLLFVAGTHAIGTISPGYSHVRQTVSELGEVGSPGQFAFSALLCLIAACLVIFASGVARSHRGLGCSVLPAWFVVAMAISCAGVGLFSYPHPLHNVFGLSETVGLQAPLVAALVCWRTARAKSIANYSIVMYVVVLAAIAVNFIPLVRPAGLWPLVRPFLGIVQRFLFLSWFVWCAGYAMLLLQVARADDSIQRTRDARH